MGFTLQNISHSIACVIVCVLCWWVRDYLVLIGDNILGAGKNMERGTPGKHQMQYSTKQCADPKKWER